MVLKRERFSISISIRANEPTSIEISGKAEGTMQIQFMGGAQTVTGSQHLLSINGHKILLECGLFQGPRKESYEKNLTFRYDPADIDVMLLSHAHIDHCGNIPNLVKKGFLTKVSHGNSKKVVFSDQPFIQDLKNLLSALI